MRRYIKIYGPPLLKALKELEKIAVSMPQVCIMNTTFLQGGYEFNTQTGIIDYFTGIGARPIELTKERCDKIISKSGEMLGEYDFFFEWFKEPTRTELDGLISKIDEVLAPLGVKYTITSKR